MKTMNFARLTLFLGLLFGAGLFFPSCSKETLQDSKDNPVLLPQEQVMSTNMVSTADLRNQPTWFSYTDRMTRFLIARFEVLSGPKTAQVSMELYAGDYDYLSFMALSTTTAYPGNLISVPIVVRPGVIYTIILKTWSKSDKGDIISQHFTSRKILKISLEQPVTVAIPGPVQGTFITGRLVVLQA